MCSCCWQSLALLLLQRELSRVGTGRSSGEDTGTCLPCGHVGRGPGSMEGACVVTCQQACSFRPAGGRVVVDMVHARMSSFSWLLLFHFLYKWTVEDYSL